MLQTTERAKVEASREVQVAIIAKIQKLLAAANFPTLCADNARLKFALCDEHLAPIVKQYKGISMNFDLSRTAFKYLADAMLSVAVQQRTAKYMAEIAGATQKAQYAAESTIGADKHTLAACIASFLEKYNIRTEATCALEEKKALLKCTVVIVKQRLSTG